MKLKELQEEFLSAVTTEEFLRGIKKSMIPGGKLTKEKCLMAYKNDYTARLSTTLGDNFESLWTILGDEEFFKLTHDYIKANPSKLYDLGEYGDRLPEFLVDHELPYLSELAQLEIEFRRLFNGAPAQAVAQSKLASLVDPSETVFKLTPLIYHSNSKFPLYRIWELRGNNSEEAFNSIEWKSENFVMYNTTGTVQVFFLSTFQSDLFGQLTRGNSLSAALECCRGGSEQEVSELFSNLVVNQLVIALD